MSDSKTEYSYSGGRIDHAEPFRETKLHYIGFRRRHSIDRIMHKWRKATLNAAAYGRLLNFNAIEAINDSLEVVDLNKVLR